MLSDHLLRQMVDAMPMPVFVKDENDGFLYANRSFDNLFQVRADQLLRSPNGSPSATTPSLLPMGDCPLAEATTFRTPTGELITMTMFHTEAFVQNQTPELEAAKAELREVRAELARMRETDPVTQTLSRRALRAHTEDAMATEPAGVLRISVDDFESVSKRFGQDVGDDLLADLCDIVRANTRPDDVFARIDDSEFTLVLRDVDRAQTTGIARRICAAVTDARTADGKPKMALSVTVGGAYSDDVDVQLSELIDEAEQALRSASRFQNEAVFA